MDPTPSAEHRRDYDQRITSILHSAIVSGLVAYIYFYTPLFSEDEAAYGTIMLRTHWLAKATMAFSLGYFLFDTCEYGEGASRPALASGGSDLPYPRPQ